MKNKAGRKKYFLFLLMIMVICSNMTAMASETTGAGKRITKSYTFTTNNEKETHDEQFPKNIKEKSSSYKLDNISYEVIQKEPVITEKEVEKVIESDVIPEGTTFEPEKTIVEDGNTYTYVSHTPIEDNSDLQTVTGYYDYDHSVTESEVPATREFTITKDGKDHKVMCSLTGIEQLNTGTWEDTYINITFISYDSSTFEWNGIEVPKNESHPLQGYENELLASVGANASNYRVNNISWSGGAYDNNGTICRDAIASVQKYVKYYRANYSGTFDPGTKYQVIYEGTEKVESDTDFNYEIKATAEYTKSLPVAYMVGIGIIVLIILVILILYLLSRKKKDKESEEV